MINSWIETRQPLTPAGVRPSLMRAELLRTVRKDDGPTAASDGWRFRTTPPDYRDRLLCDA